MHIQDSVWGGSMREARSGRCGGQVKRWVIECSRLLTFLWLVGHYFKEALASPKCSPCTRPNGHCGKAPYSRGLPLQEHAWSKIYRHISLSGTGLGGPHSSTLYTPAVSLFCNVHVLDIRYMYVFVPCYTCTCLRLAICVGHA